MIKKDFKSLLTKHGYTNIDFSWDIFMSFKNDEIGIIKVIDNMVMI